MANLKKKSTRQLNKSSATKQTRPPVVVVMGHVDHGKTTLLDALRAYKSTEKSPSLTTKEHGGITQHIGAYQVRCQKKLITFLDTPGHEAFAKMRARGAQVADIAILVVAANDGVKPQTKEAISHIRKAKIPVIVAVNKIDLPEASVDMVKSQLAENEVLVEGYGGDTVCVAISAKQNKNINQLLEMILLVAEMQELTASSKNSLQAYVLESFLDSSKGIIANIIVKDGQLKAGDEVVAVLSGQLKKVMAKGKIKAIFNEYGKQISSVKPGQPAQILGFKTAPLVGSQVIASRQVLVDQTEELPSSEEQEKKLTKETKQEQEDDLNSEEKPKLTVVLKADVQGTLEAIKTNLTEEVELVGEGVGDITESDVLLAQSTEAQLIGFHVQIPVQVKKLAAMEKVKIKTYEVIYRLLEDIQKQVLQMLEPAINEEVLGEAEVIAEFKIKDKHIAGCKVTSGAIAKNDRIRIMRGKEIVGEPREIASFQKEREEVAKVKKGEEVGIVFKPDIPFQIGDGIISYKVVS